jgi:thiol-disulfide isomerase/thioredoxin
MNRLFLLTAFFLTAATAALLPDRVTGQESTDLLPSDPAAWVNSPPLSVESLKGKAVVLWFYEEQCPKCRGKWPAMYELARKFEDQPVLFIAVNSGTPRPAVEQYAKGVDLKWPIIVDPSRQFEKQWMDGEISLQNIHQVGLILPTGRKDMGRWDDLEGSVQKALEGAAWKIDPATIPQALMPTWRLIELGKYSAAAPLLKKGLVTSNAEVKEAATRVHAVVQEELKTAAEEAAATRQGGDPWPAYRQYQSIATKFAGYDLPLDVAAAQKELAADPKVKQQLEAAKALEVIQKSFPTARTPAARKRVITRLEQFVKQFADTEAAEQAQRILAQAANAQQ